MKDLLESFLNDEDIRMSILENTYLNDDIENIFIPTNLEFTWDNINMVTTRANIKNNSENISTSSNIRTLYLNTLILLNSIKDFDTNLYEKMRKKLKCLKELFNEIKSFLKPSLNNHIRNTLTEYSNLSQKKVKLMIERRFYKSLYNLIKKDSMEIEDKIFKLLFQGIENKYSPEKCLLSL